MLSREKFLFCIFIAGVMFQGPGYTRGSFQDVRHEHSCLLAILVADK